MADLVFARVGMLVQQLARHQHEPGRAEAALEGTALDERLLYGIQSRSAVVLDCDDVCALDERRQIEAAGDRLSIDEHRAATAQSLTAALARAEERELLLQQFDEIVVRRDLGRNRFAVERKPYRVQYSAH
jgi:hypothetical protein